MYLISRKAIHVKYCVSLEMSSETYYKAAGEQKPIKLKNLKKGKYYKLLNPIQLNGNSVRQAKLDKLYQTPYLLSSKVMEYGISPRAIGDEIRLLFTNGSGTIILFASLLPDQEDTLFVEMPTSIYRPAPGAAQGGKRKSRKRISKKSKRTRKY